MPKISLLLGSLTPRRSHSQSNGSYWLPSPGSWSLNRGQCARCVLSQAGQSVVQRMVQRMPWGQTAWELGLPWREGGGEVCREDPVLTGFRLLSHCVYN